MRVLALACSILLPSTAVAQTVPLAANDAQSGDLFGAAIGASNGRVLIGAPDDDHSGKDRAGSAYLFDAATGNQLAWFKAPEVADFDQTGYAVALSGDLALLASPRSDRVAHDAGAGYVIDVTTGQLVTRLFAPDGAPDDLLGWSADLRGTLAVLGAIADDDNGVSSGSAYVFDALTGQLLAKLLPSDGDAQDLFGISVAIGPDHIVVGAHRDDDVALDAGSVYVFDVGTWTQSAKLQPLDPQPFAEFGTSVALDDDRLAVGAPRLDNPNPPPGGFAVDSGGVYLFDLSTGLQTARLVHDHRRAYDYFGRSVALAGDSLVVGVVNDDAVIGNAGAAYLFGLASAGTPEKLIFPSSSWSAGFGHGVAVDGDRAFASSPSQDGPVINSGLAYAHTISGPGPGSAFCFGDGSGAACPCNAAGGPREGCGNSSEWGAAALLGSGTASIANDGFLLQATGLPASKPSIVLRASSLLNGGLGNPLGSGLLCITGQTARSQVVSSNSFGFAVFSDFKGDPFGAWSYGPGQQTLYQVWYRDPATTCAGGFNFTNAWGVTWQL